MNGAYKRVVLIFIFSVMVLSSLAVFAQAQQYDFAQANKQILILIGPQYGLPMVNVITPAIVDTFVSTGVSVDDIFVEFLDLHRFPGERHRFNIFTTLQQKLTDKNIGLIVAINQSAVDFVAQEGHNFFPDVPMLIPIFEAEPAWIDAPRRVITLLSQLDAEGTLRHVFNLFPRTRRVVIIMGKDDARAPFAELLNKALDELPREIKIEDTSELTYEEMLHYASSLPDDTIAIYGSYFEDITGQTFIPAEVAAQVALAANVPVFALRDMHIIQGLLGGSVTHTSKLGNQAAEIGLDYLHGQLLLTQQTTTIEVTNFPLFDWQQLRRWGADPERLPDETVFLNYTPTFWEYHRDLIILTGLFVLALVCMLTLLLINNRRLKIAEQGLLAYNRGLDKLVAERTAQLDVKAKELEIFAYSVSHDLKAPLRGIDGYSRLLLEDYSERLDEEGRTFLNNIRHSVEQMNRLIEDLLAYSRLERRTWRETSFSLRALVQSVVICCEAELEQRSGTLSVDVPDVFVTTDREGLALVLRNLLDNALKYTPSSRKPEIMIGSEEREKIIILFVRDNGIGFDMKYHELIFGIFNRLHRIEEYPGTGIGLAMVRKATERMGGRIWAESQLGKGTTFYLELPYKES